eukprot:COSAG01_NODE_23403_length_816_cov_2.476987_1_plen_119_part_10
MAVVTALDSGRPPPRSVQPRRGPARAHSRPVSGQRVAVPMSNCFQFLGDIFNRHAPTAEYIIVEPTADSISGFLREAVGHALLHGGKLVHRLRHRSVPVPTSFQPQAAGSTAWPSAYPC